MSSMPSTSMFRLIGRPESGYTLKVRSALRYKGLEFQWLDRFEHSKLFKKHAKVQLIPLVFLPDGTAMQDSTPILEKLEAHRAEPSLHPTDPTLRYLSYLMEDYGDEWVNKLMFHYRWRYPADQDRRGSSLAAGIIDGSGFGWLKPLLLPIGKRLLIRRMLPRLAFAGANENNEPILVESLSKLIDRLNAHLSGRRYLFGARPAFGDFGLWGQLYQAWEDPTCHAIFERRAPEVVAWLKRMVAPLAEGEFESLPSLATTLKPIFADEIGARFLAWSDANAKAYAAGRPNTELQMGGRRYHQKTFKYPSRSLGILRAKLREVGPNDELSFFLKDTGCLAYLQT